MNKAGRNPPLRGAGGTGSNPPPRGGGRGAFYLEMDMLEALLVLETLDRVALELEMKEENPSKEAEMIGTLYRRLAATIAQGRTNR